MRLACGSDDGAGGCAEEEPFGGAGDAMPSAATLGDADGVVTFFGERGGLRSFVGDFVGRSSCAERDADENAALFGVHSDPERVAVLPVDLVPGGLNFLRNFDGLAAVENVQAGATRDDHLVFADAEPAHGRRADFARNFGDGLGST